MAEGRGRAEWSRTSEILAMLFNSHRDPKKQKERKPQDFNPYPKEKDAKPAAKSDLKILKTLFVDMKQRGSTR